MPGLPGVDRTGSLETASPTSLPTEGRDLRDCTFIKDHSVALFLGDVQHLKNFI